MPAKDYYKILDVVPAASQMEIKKAYRQLAMKYHPDRNENNPSATAHFRQVLEAYQVLSDPHRRSAYNQQRWYRRTNRRDFAEELLSPDNFLKTSQRLSRYINTIGEFRVDEQALYQYMMKLLKNELIDALLESNPPDTNNRIIEELLRASEPLSFRYFRMLEQPLTRLAGSSTSMKRLIGSKVKQRKWQSYWQKYQALLIVLAAMVLCWLLYRIGT